ncbi:MAG: right-handed parallel beta-helix repeat-containing protein [Phycisphaerales bacterium]
MSDVDRRSILAGLAGVGGVAALASMAGAAQPAAGRPARASTDGRRLLTGRTGTLTISWPGSYALAGDICAVEGKNGIVIDASGVSLDLNGFTVRSETLAGYGITTGAGGRTGVSVCGGKVSGFSVGVFLGTNGTTDSWVSAEDLVIHRPGTLGVYVFSPLVSGLGIVRRCTVWQAGYATSPATTGDASGILMLNACGVIEDCVVVEVINSSSGYGAYGINQFGGTEVMVVDNRVTRCGTGIRLHQASGVVYRDNIVTGSIRAWDAGGATDGGGNVS